MERQKPKDFNHSRSETRTCNWSPACFQEDISSWFTDTHRIIITTGDPLQIKVPQNQHPAPLKHHRTTLTAIPCQLPWHPSLLCTAACPGQNSTFNCVLPDFTGNKAGFSSWPSWALLRHPSKTAGFAPLIILGMVTCWSCAQFTALKNDCDYWTILYVVYKEQ